MDNFIHCGTRVLYTVLIHKLIHTYLHVYPHAFTQGLNVVDLLHLQDFGQQEYLSLFSRMSA